jgi:hydroxypyruvate isomerase
VRIAANLTWLFTEAPMLDRPALAAAAGFDGVEVLFPYDHPPEAWARVLEALPVALINTPPGDWAAGERGFAAVEGAEGRFRDGFRRALDWAAAMRAERIHVMAGNAWGVGAALAFRKNLEWAAQFGVPLTIEPLNGQDMPGYFLNSYKAGADAVRGLEGASVGLQFDTWHAARLHGVADQETRWRRVAGRWTRWRHQVAHLQVAGEPDRGEPGAAETAWLRGSGWDGWVGAEYRPRQSTPAGLGWLAQARR